MCTHTRIHTRTDINIHTHTRLSTSWVSVSAQTDSHTHTHTVTHTRLRAPCGCESTHLHTRIPTRTSEGTVWLCTCNYPYTSIHARGHNRLWRSTHHFQASTAINFLSLTIHIEALLHTESILGEWTALLDYNSIPPIQISLRKRVARDISPPPLPPHNLYFSHTFDDLANLDFSPRNLHVCMMYVQLSHMHTWDSILHYFSTRAPCVCESAHTQSESRRGMGHTHTYMSHGTCVLKGYVVSDRQGRYGSRAR